MSGIASNPRYHVVLIPGFGGIDSLGQLEYYHGVTQRFRASKAGRNVVLHYFDNLPTAAVVTRAARLRRYLAKRIARCEICPDDEVTLVGHSTGGLDIRQLIADLHDDPDAAGTVDGGVPVRCSEIRRHIRRVVFLSVPHWGTNAADWVHGHSIGRQAFVAKLRVEVAGSQVPFVNVIEHIAAGGAVSLLNADLLRAVHDALLEADPAIGAATPERTSEAFEAEAALALYLRHIASDFRVIDDLTAERPLKPPFSPAHFDEQQRAEELERWLHPGCPIETLSYVTISRSPFRFAAGRPAPLWELTKLWTYPEVLKDEDLSRDTDLTYRMCYRACAGGPFRIPPQDLQVERCAGPVSHDRIEVWHNDGIVNTASMFWPTGPNVVVECDHMDIVGHYRLVEAAEGAARIFTAYDLLKSTPQFRGETFEQVWGEIFDFSAGEGVPAGRASAATADVAACS